MESRSAQVRKSASPALFEDHAIRRVYDEATETWWFSVVDIMQVLTQQRHYQTARKYWNKLKERLRKEGSQSVTSCHRLRLPAADGKMYLTDAATAETLLRLVQSVPSPKAEPIKLWLAKVGYERMQEMSDPEQSIDRARENWKKHGYSEEWIRHSHKHHSRGMGRGQRQAAQESEGTQGRQPTRSHDRGRTGIHRTGGALYASDRRERRGIGDEGE